MKITFVTDTMHCGGSERVISELANYFAKANEVSLVCLRRRVVDYDISSNVRVLFADDHCRSMVQKVFWFNKVARQEGGVVIAFMVPVYIFTLVSLLFTRIPVIISERNDPEAASLFRKVARRLLLFRAQSIVVQTNDIKNYFPKKYQDKTVVIKNPISEKFESGAALTAAKEDTIISVGRLDEQKNQRLMIEAFSEIASDYPGYSLKIYGEGPLRGELHKLIDEKGLSGRVFLMGKSTEIFAHLCSSRIFVLTSDYEGFSNALTEAMCVGLPVVSTKVSGTQETIVSGKNGLLVEKRNKPELVRALRALLDNPQFAYKLAVEAVKIKETVDFETICRQWQNVINDITRDE